MTSFRNLESLFRRDAEQPDALPADPTAVSTATHALLLAGAGPDWWPYAVLVSAEMVAVHLAGARCPAPRQPWGPGPEPRLWLSTREEIRRTAERERLPLDLSRLKKGPRPVLLGVYEDGRVYIDVARAPGPLVVSGTEPWATKVRELLGAQLPTESVLRGDMSMPSSMPDAYWPIRVPDASTISMLGCALAGVVKHPELMRASMAERRALQAPPTPAAMIAPAPTTLSAPVAMVDAAPVRAAVSAPAPVPPPPLAPRPQPALPPTPQQQPTQAPRRPAPQRRPAPPALPASVFEVPAVSARAAESAAMETTAYIAVPRPAPPRAPVHMLPGSTTRPPRPAAPPNVTWDDVAVSSAESD